MRDGSAVIVCRTSLEIEFSSSPLSQRFEGLSTQWRITEMLVLLCVWIDHVRSPSRGQMLLADACGDV